MEELAPLIDELQRLTWQREYAEALLETKERALLAARRSLCERTANVLQTSVGARNAVRRVIVRATAAAVNSKRLVLPTDNLKVRRAPRRAATRDDAAQNNLDAFDVREVPGREQVALDVGKMPQAQLRRGLAELELTTFEIQQSAADLCAALLPLQRLLEQLNM